MNFQEACEMTVKQSKEENRLCYLYKNRIGNFTWGVSHQYWKDWLFKAYPGGRKVLSVEGTKLMQSESGPTPRAPDACPYCAGKGVNHFGGLILKDCIHCSGTGQRR